jgi:hypothetical protein
MEALAQKDPLDILAYQYDIVCNGCELSSGAIRNHLPEVMYKAFEIAGYPPETVDTRFGALIRAFRLGAPPHGGLGARRGSHRDAAGAGDEYPRGDCLPDESACAGSDDGCTEPGERKAASRVAYSLAVAAQRGARDGCRRVRLAWKRLDGQVVTRYLLARVADNLRHGGDF